ncbi:MAG: RagB/SusD family nutrient uptake outer membrane protein [Gemmatimonadales bacterium]|nr:MAG: RagB/SusD family nutrient uptake outer membrane protein [Gemmatimonadales bacterium]
MRRTWNSRRGIIALVPFALVGCGDLFEVSNPTNIIDEELDDPLMITALANSPEAAFAEGYANIILDAALPTDEGTHHSTRASRLELMTGVFLSWNEQYDARYNEMARARWLADDVVVRLQTLLDSPNNDVRTARAYYWGGMSRLFLAKHFFEVPLDGNPPQSPPAILEDALSRFDQAAEIAGAAGDANLRAAILGSRARTLRALYFERGEQMTYFERAAQAATQALEVLPSYQVDVRYQQPGSQNSVFARAATGQLYDGMHPSFANRIDPVTGERDPRIVHSEILGTDPQGLDIYEPLKYDGRNADVPASRWQEAELILAEYHLLTGALPQAVSRINRVRAAAGLGEFSSADAGEIRGQLMYERETEFWLEGRRWADMRYYNLIPAGWIPESQAAGWRRWPVSQQERDTNPHYRSGG